MGDQFVRPEDYQEPCCPLKRPDAAEPLPIRRILDKFDGYLNKNDYDAAGRLLSRWLREPEAEADLRGRLTLLNEQIGICRKTGREAEGLRAIEEALELVQTLGLEETVSAGTTFVNAATALKAFNRPEDALSLYRRAQVLYEKNLKSDDERLGSLYNNMALTVMSLGDTAEAEQLFFKAIDIMAFKENGELEIAITYCNLADLAAGRDGLEKAENRIAQYLEKAETLLDTETLPHNGYYAFVCEKCAPVFGYYGYFLTEQRLKKTAKEIYERA